MTEPDAGTRTRMAAPPRQRRTLDALSLLLLVVALALHLHFCLLDTRGEPDLGHYYRGAVEAARAALLGSGVQLGFAEPGYSWLLAGSWSIFGASAWGLDLLEGVWLAALGVGAWLAGRSVGGPAGGVLSLLAVVVFPSFAQGARTHWIHHPEVSLGTLALGLAAVLPPRWWAGLAVGGLVGFGATVRPSAVVWLAAPLALWIARSRSHRSAWLPALCLGVLGAAAHAAILPSYLGLRVGNRAANAAAVGSLWPLIPRQTGALQGGLYLLFAVGGLALWLRRGAQSGRPVVAIALFWVGGGLAVLLISAAGPDNVPTAFMGLALLAALAGRLALVARFVPALALALALLGPLNQVWPTHPGATVTGALTHWNPEPHRLNWLIPSSTGPTAAAVFEAAVAACPPDRTPSRAPTRRPRCRVLLDAGLFHPSWEDDGALGLFLAGYFGIDAQAAPGLVDRRPFDVAASTRCTGPTVDPSGRFPDAAARFEAELADRPVVRTLAFGDCTQIWYGPRPRRHLR